MAYIQERKDGNGKNHYRVQIRLKGHPTVSATFDRKTDAKEWAKQTETDIKRGRFFQSLEAQKHTFAEMIDRYLKDVMPRKSADQRIVAKKSPFTKPDIACQRSYLEATPPKLE